MKIAIINSEGTVENIIVAEKEYMARLGEIYPDKKVVEYTEQKQSETAGKGFYYNEQEKYFVPYKSWTIDESGKYRSKHPYPQDGKDYIWNEKLEQWDEIKTKKPDEKPIKS